MFIAVFSWHRLPFTHLSPSFFCVCSFSSGMIILQLCGKNCVSAIWKWLSLTYQILTFTSKILTFIMQKTNVNASNCNMVGFACFYWSQWLWQKNAHKLLTTKNLYLCVYFFFFLRYFYFIRFCKWETDRERVGSRTEFWIVNG